MNRSFDFEDIRPYNDEEINPALRRITAEPVFQNILDYLFPEEYKDEIVAKINEITSAIEFQKIFMHPAIRSIIKQTSDGLTYSGFDNIDPDKAYLFIANHHDILLDSAILQILLVEHGLETSEITFGSNLMSSEFIIDAGKVNRMFIVIRDGTKREMLVNSKRLSEYMRYAIIEKNTSLWIAQGKGRTKDGKDKTEPGLLTMLNLSGTGNFAENFSGLNIIPVTISYEYEPCDVFKARELYFSLNAPYKKSQGEDINSLITGITQQKGRIHFVVGKPINDKLPEIENKASNDKINELARTIDRQIYDDYKLWKTNYIAYDLVYKKNKYVSFYTYEEKEAFEQYMSKQLNNIRADKKVLQQIFLKIYANPVVNKDNLNQI